jgi:hypothetical protein
MLLQSCLPSRRHPLLRAATAFRQCVVARMPCTGFLLRTWGRRCVRAA